MPDSNQKRILPSIALLLLVVAILLTGLHKQRSGLPSNWVAGWLELSSFHYPRRALAATTSNGYLYVVGGVDAQGQYVRPVEYARILADGRLGDWKETSPLLKGRFYLAAVSHEGYLYALGGGGGELGDDNAPLASVERAKINPDGSLQNWQHHSYLTTPRRGLKASVVNDRLYAIGGYNGQFLKSIEHLDLDEPGHTDPWQLDPEQARIDRYIHAAATMGNRLFLLGGHVEKGGPMSYGDVESAIIGADGWLEPWQIAETHLLNPRFIASAFALGKHLYIVGGHDGVRRLASVEMTTVSSNGKLGTWSELDPLNHKRSATAVALAGERVYIAGGMDDQGVLRSVEMAQSGPSGRLGHLRPINIGMTGTATAP
jgi:hypothetical protein